MGQPGLLFIGFEVQPGEDCFHLGRAGLATYVFAGLLLCVYSSLTTSCSESTGFHPCSQQASAVSSHRQELVRAVGQPGAAHLFGIDLVQHSPLFSHFLTWNAYSNHHHHQDSKTYAVWAWFGTPLGLLPQTDVLANPVQLWARLVSQAFLAVILPAHLPHPFGAHLASEAIIHGHLFPHGFCLGHSAAPSFFIHFVLGGAGIIADLILG